MTGITFENTDWGNVIMVGGFGVATMAGSAVLWFAKWRGIVEFKGLQLAENSKLWDAISIEQRKTTDVQLDNEKRFALKTDVKSLQDHMDNRFDQVMQALERRGAPRP